MSSMQDLIKLLIKAVEVNLQTGYSQAAALTFLLLDLIHNFKDEIQYIWPARPSLAKYLYLFSRYWGIGLLASLLISDRSQHSETYCKGYIWWMTLGGMYTLEVSLSITFMLRLYALYGQSRIALGIFTALYACQMGVELYTIIWVSKLAVVNIIPAPVPMWTGCVVNALNLSTARVLAGWVPVFTISTGILIATIVKLRHSIISDAKNDNSTGSSQKARPGRLRIPPLLEVFVRDGMVYFAIVTATYVGKAFTTLYQGSLYSLPVNPWFEAIFSISSCHMLLNLRRSVGEQGTTVVSGSDSNYVLSDVNVGGGRSVSALSAMRFESSSRTGGAPGENKGLSGDLAWARLGV